MSPRPPRLRTALLLASVLLGVPACSTDDQLAQERLERLGYTNITLTKEEQGVYRFTATDDTGNAACRGSLRVVRVHPLRPRTARIGGTKDCHIPTGK